VELGAIAVDVAQEGHTYEWTLSHDEWKTPTEELGRIIPKGTGDASQTATLEVYPAAPEGTVFFVTATETHSGDEGTATVTVTLPPAVLTATPSGRLQIYNDTQTVSVAVKGDDIGGKDGTVPFALANLSRAGDQKTNMPRGVTVSGSYDVENGNLTGTMVLGGVPMFTDERERTITLTINGKTCTFALTILGPPQPELTAGDPDPNPVVGNSSVHIPLNSKYLPVRGAMLFDTDKLNNENSFLQVEMPAGFTYDKGSQFYNDLFTSQGTGFLRLRVPADIKKGTYTVKVNWAADPTVFVEIEIVADWKDEQFPIHVDEDGNLKWPAHEDENGVVLVPYYLYAWYSPEGKDPLSHDTSCQFLYQTLNSIFHELNLLDYQPGPYESVGNPGKPTLIPQPFFKRGQSYWIMIKTNNDSAHPIFNDWRLVTIP
jgi:hypothetical protein